MKVSLNCYFSVGGVKVPKGTVFNGAFRDLPSWVQTEVKAKSKFLTITEDVKVVVTDPEPPVTDPEPVTKEKVSEASEPPVTDPEPPVTDSEKEKPKARKIVRKSKGK